MEKSLNNKSNSRCTNDMEKNSTSEEQDVMVIYERINPFDGMIYDEQQDVEMEE